MPTEFKVKYPRSGVVFSIPPEKITVRPTLNGRTELPDIEWIIESFLAVGQIQPVEIRKEANKPVLTSGYSRWRAGIEINKRKLVPGGFQLRCVYAKRNEHEGFLANLHENLVRNATTPLDDMNNVRQLETWGRTHEEIAQIYHRTTAKGAPDVKWVRSQLELVSLGEEARTALKDGRLKVTAAKAIAKLSEDEQRGELEQVLSGKKLTPAAESNGAAHKPSTSMRRAVVLETLRVIVEDKKLPAGFDIDGLTAENAVLVVCAKLREML